MSYSEKEKVNVLIVDDKKENLFVLEKLLTPLNINVHKATSGNDAISMVLQEDFGLILLDVQMPEMDGYEVMEFLRFERRLRNVPVIFVTAYYKEEEHKLKGYDLGAADYLYKPLDERVLLSKVGVFLELYKQKRENLRLKQRYELILDSAGEGIFGLDTEGRFNFVNPAAALLLGWNVNELLGNSISIIMPDSSQFKWEESEIYQTSYTGYFHRVIEGDFLKKDRTSLPVDYVITSIRNESNAYVGVVVAFQDISDRKLKQEAERKLQQSVKMEAIGQLTGGVAHDFNNILLITQGNLELIENHVDKESALHGNVQEALKAVERGSELTKHLLAFARKQTLFPKPISVEEHLKNIILLLKPALSERISIDVINQESKLWPIWVDPIEFENAIMNLALNARDAMPRGGTLRITLKNKSIHEQPTLINEQVKSGDYVNITISDQGVGMPADVMERIFEPFYTTKDVGVGTGLGLSMVYGFIKQSNGYISVESSVGNGTSFNLLFPRSIHENKEVIPEKRSSDDLRGSEVILIAEDEPSILALVSTFLTSLGYKVVTSTTGAEALEIVKSGKPIDLLFTDVVMPGGLTGPELATEVKNHLPNINVLFTSGYAKDAMAHAGDISDNVHYLVKPYRLELLATKLRSILNKKAE